MLKETTIIIPELSKPHFLEHCIEALIRNSYYRHRILVIASGMRDIIRDYTYDRNTKKKSYKYEFLENFFEERSKWLKDNNVTIIDITERAANFRKEYEKDGKFYEGGVDVSFKDNIGAEYIDNEGWFMWNWDDDFVAAPDWDINLFKHVDENDFNRVYVPTHTQPYFADNERIFTIDKNDVWTTSKHIATNAPTLPIFSRTEHYLLESEMKEFVKLNSIDDVMKEKCSIRRDVHWVPMLINKFLYSKIGGSNYQGCAYDLALDDTLGRLGIMKTTSRSSFIIHRGHMIWDQ